MSSRDRSRKIRELLERFLHRTIEANSSVVNTRERLRIRFVAGLSLVAIPIMLYLQLDSDLFPVGIPMYYILAGLIFVAYLLSRAGYLQISTWIVLVCFSLFPYIALLLRGSWTLANNTILVWIAITMLIGGFLLSRRESAILVVSHNVVFTLVVLYHPGVNIYLENGFQESILPLLAISILIYAGSWARTHYIELLEDKNEELYAARRELEIYSSLLTHDLRNDLFVLFGRMQLTQSSMPQGHPATDGDLRTSIEIAKRMGRVLNAFSDVSLIEENVMDMIRRVADQAVSAHPGMDIEVRADEGSEEVRIKTRLLPMAFDNLFRNSAMYAGESCSVVVSISRGDEVLEIEVSDDGPGIEPHLQESLFKRGTTTGEGTGLGLYLTGRIIAHHGRTIELLEKVNGCTFRIALPV